MIDTITSFFLFIKFLRVSNIVVFPFFYFRLKKLQNSDEVIVTKYIHFIGNWILTSYTRSVTQLISRGDVLTNVTAGVAEDKIRRRSERKLMRLRSLNELVMS